MNLPNTTTEIYVTYQGSKDDRFDRNYYESEHLLLVMKAWRQYGLVSARAFFPASSQDGTVAICQMRFRDDAAVQTSFASSETLEVMADVPRFTDLAPMRLKAVAL